MLIRLATSVPTALKTWFARVTRSRITIACFLFVLANYVAQTTLHAVVFSGYARDLDHVTSAIDSAGVQRGFTYVRQDVLEICSGIPTVHGTKCHTVYNDSAISTPASALGVQCAEGLTWLENYLRDATSEEVVYLVLESWLVVISLVALIDESIPHLIVVLGAQVVDTSWISYRITSDISEKRVYDKMIVDGACGAFDILGGSWQLNMFYVILGFSIAALLGILFFVFKLVKLYSTETLSSVGSSLVINGMLKWRLWMRVFLQFTAFFTLASAAVWYDKRKNNMIAPYSTNILYDAGFYVVAIMLLPWFALGTYSVTKEKRLLFLVYAFLSIGLLVISGLLFGSALFRYEYGAWHFFRCVTTMADVLLVITCIFSFICRVNFGRGLAHFLVVEQKLQASGFAPDIFLHDPSVDTKQVFTSNHPESLSYPAINSSHSSFKTLQHSPSACSIGSAVFATWLSSQGSRDQEKCQLQTVKEEGPASIIFISREDIRPCSVQSISDNESSTWDEAEEKQKIVS